jgi:hypothetical protein
MYHGVIISTQAREQVFARTTLRFRSIAFREAVRLLVLREGGVGSCGLRGDLSLVRGVLDALDSRTCGRFIEVQHVLESQLQTHISDRDGRATE